MSELLKGVKIWNGKVNAKDTYVDFKGKFNAFGGEKIFLRISCDSNYTVYLNGRLAGFAACADYPWYRNYDETDITRFCSEENEIAVTVWHYGDDSQTYINSEAYLLFDIIQGDNTLLKSDKNILSRVNPHYKNGYCKRISPQLGLSFLYDATTEETPFSASDETGEGVAVLRKRGNCELKARAKSSVIAAEDGFLVDTGKETVGFLDLEFFSDAVQKITVSYAEHLTDGAVRRKIGTCDFSAEYVAKAGYNEYLNTFRRIAGRYLLIESEAPIKLRYAGIRPVEYPFKETKRAFADESLQKIYDVSIYTLKCCMHEHYEDCPWREQAMYALDSRNQMLCGYYAFKGYVCQRENLLIISKGLRSDGLLTLCFPTGKDYPIPFFSLVYVMQVWEYIEHTGDCRILFEVGETVDKIMQTFGARMEENGLIADFEYPYWNFYEWTDGSDNSWQLNRKEGDYCEKQYDLILNCFYIIACGYYEKLTGARIPTEKTREAVKKTFFDGGKNSYKLSTVGEARYSQLGNAMAILAGVADASVAETTICDETLVKISLSMNGFYYDALLKTSEKYKEFVIEDIKTKYGKMLKAGATTFWETEKGWEDFGELGSLCHGWSALPVVYLSRYYK